MNEQLLITVSIVTLSVACLFEAIVIIGATLYDFRQIGKSRRLEKVYKRIRKPNQPKIAVLIYAHNDSASLTNCINSVARSNYKNYQIIVIDNASKDQTKKILKEYQLRHKKMALTVYAKRKTSSYGKALKQGYKKASDCDLVLVTDAKSYLPPKALRRAAIEFIDNPNLETLKIGQKALGPVSLLVAMIKLKQLSANQYGKFRSLIPLGQIMMGSGNVYRSKVFWTLTRQKQTNKSKGLKFNILKVLLVGKYFMVGLAMLTTALLVTFFAYNAVTLQSSGFFILSWVMVVVWLISAIWADELSTIAEKLELIFCTPIVYFIGYVQLLFLLISWVPKPMHVVQEK